MSETSDEQTETPTPKNLPQYVADQVGFDIIYRKHRYGTLAEGQLTARANTNKGCDFGQVALNNTSPCDHYHTMNDQYMWCSAMSTRGDITSLGIGLQVFDILYIGLQRFSIQIL